MTRIKRLIILCPLILAACGNDGPSRGDVEHALNKAVQQANAADGGGVSPIIVIDTSCKARENSIYRCTVKASQDGMVGVHIVDFARIDNDWTEAGIVN